MTTTNTKKSFPPDTLLLIKLSDAQILMDYLVSKPGGEVFKLIPLLINLPFANPEVNNATVTDDVTVPLDGVKEEANSEALTQ